MRYRSILVPMLAAFVAWQGSPLQAPPIKVQLEVDGQAYQLTSGKSAKVKIGNSEHTVMVRALPYRRLELHGIAFDFPLNASFEREDGPDENPKTWTIETADLTVIVFEFASGSPTEMAKVLSASMSGDQNDAGAKPCKLRLGGEQVAGFEANVQILGTAFCNRSVGVGAAGKSYVIQLQDAVGEDGAPSADMKIMQRLLDQTFAVVKR